MGAPPDSDREAISGFECLHRIAQSYLGPLWIASDLRSDGGPLRLVRRLALPEGTTAEARSQIATLARRAMRIEHPNVLRVLDVLDQDELLVGVYESAEAEPLRSLQSWANLRGLSFPVGVALRILVDLLQGIAALHELGRASPELGVAGGLSPDSVLISRSGATQLSDPLIASGAALLDGIGFNTAKLAYAAPEQVHATAPLTPGADLFTCGAMLWELLASRRLLAGSRPAIERKLLEHNLPSLRSSLRGPQQVSDALVELVERSLGADPATRPASAAELAAALGSSGHELASLDEVAAFVSKLSGPRFDRRTAAIRSRTPQPFDEVKSAGVPKGATLLGVAPVGVVAPPSDIETPRATSVAASTTRGAEAATAAPDEGAPEGAEEAEDAAPASEPSSPFLLGKGAFTPAPVEPPGLGLTPPSPPVRGGPLWNSMVTAATPKVSVASPLSPFGSRTIKGTGAPEHPALAVSQPFANITPEPFSAVQAEDGVAPKPAGEGTRQSSDPFAAPASVAGPPRPRSPFDAPAEPAPPRPRSPFDEPPPGDAVADLPRASRPSNPFDAPADAGAAQRPSHPFDVAPVAGASSAGPPVPFQHLLPHSKGARTSQAPHTQSYFELSSPAAQSLPAGGNTSVFSRYKLGIGLGAGALLVAVGVWLALGRSASSGVAPGVTASRDLPAAAEPSTPPTEGPAATTRTPEPPPAPVAAAADAGAKPEAPAKVAPPPGESAPPARAADFAAAQLDDSQLVVLFALEGRNTLPTCSERLGESVAKYTGSDLRRSQLQIKAAKRQLGKGDTAAAHELACSAVAHNPQNAAAQRNLAEIALQLGDAAQAKAAVDKGLARAPKDKGLMALSGDVLAMMGDIAGSRAMWLRAAPPRGGKAARTKRLVTAYRKLGDKALTSSNWVQAATYFRRAVILTHGNFAASLGLSEALLWLDRSRAALVWAERAAQASPKDSRIQVLFGDALYENGQNEKARAAWQAALDVQPTNRLAARRLREGKP